jgi:hypothetical protein
MPDPSSTGLEIGGLNQVIWIFAIVHDSVMYREDPPGFLFIFTLQGNTLRAGDEST